MLTGLITPTVISADEPSTESAVEEPTVPVSETSGLDRKRAAALESNLSERIKELSDQSKADPDNVDLFSARGDALFFSGEFAKSVVDYDKMLKLKPSLKDSHWRRGIALFYAGRYRDAASQFEEYHSYDNVDRENGIWRYLCQVRAYGEKYARRDLLKYEKDDREPFPAVYKLFAGELTSDEIRKQISEAKLSEGEKEKRRFYAELYIGLWESVHDRPTKARQALHQAVNNRWGPAAGFGPNYMWHVGRVHLDLLNRKAEKESKPTGDAQSKK